MSWQLQEPEPEIRVLTAIVGNQEGKVAEIITAAKPRMIVARRCADSAELLAIAHLGLGTVAVISADLPGLDRRLVQMLKVDRVGLIVINDPLDQLSMQRLAALGVTETLTFEDLDGYLLDSVARSHAMLSGPRGMPQGPRSLDSGGPAPTLAGAGAGATLEPSLQHMEFRSGNRSGPTERYADDFAGYSQVPKINGKVITVWGTSGAPGRTTVAINLAYALAQGDPSKKVKKGTGEGKRGASTLLLDADTHSPSITQSLGLLEEASGLARACHTAGQGLLDPAALEANYASITENLSLLTGLPRMARWPEISGVNLEAVFYHGKENHRWIVADCSAPTETDEILSFDTVAPQRNGATIACVEAADCILVVGKGDPIGLKRLVAALTEVYENPAFHGSTVGVVINQVRGTTAGSGSKAAIRELLAQYSQIMEPVFISYDGAGVDRALMSGRSLLEEVPTSPVSKEIVNLAHLLTTTLHARDLGQSHRLSRSVELGR